MIKMIVGIFACAFVTGCSTAAQRQVAWMMQNGRAVNEQTLSCLKAVRSNPTYEPLARRAPLDGNASSTLTQLADNAVANEEEVELIIALHNETTPCRERAVEEFMKIFPSIIPIFIQGYHQFEIVMVNLIQRKITWGEFNQRRTALRDDVMAKIRLAVGELEREFATSHYNEVAQRQAALNALSLWADRQTALMQNQQIINRLNRPRITTCSGSGYYVSCISR